MHTGCTPEIPLYIRCTSGVHPVYTGRCAGEPASRSSYVLVARLASPHVRQKVPPVCAVAADTLPAGEMGI